MALPSQSRPQSRHSYTYRRGRTFGFRGGGRGSRRRPLFVAIVALLTITVGVWGYRAMRSPSEVDGASSALAMDLNLENDRVETPPMRMMPPSVPPVEERRAAEQPRSAPATQSPAPERSTPAPPEQPSIRMGERSSTTSEPAQAKATPPQPATQHPAQPETSRETAATPVTEPVRTPTVARDAQRPTTGNAARDRATERVRSGMDLIRSNRPVEARRLLTQALDSGALSRTDAANVRQTLGELNDRLVFSPEIVPDDPFAYGYAVRPGDTLSRIASRESLSIDWRLIQRINRIPRPEQIRAGQHLKLVKGPFHAEVSKRDFRMDVYLGEGSERVFVRSFSVGLGEYDSTPIGTFRVRSNSKLIDPEWVNPRTGERFRSKDPANPIGNRWIGLEGVSEGVRDLGGYGIHGTIEPQSIGTQASMGCIRMLPADVELMYELMMEGASAVEIRE